MKVAMLFLLLLFAVPKSLVAQSDLLKAQHDLIGTRVDALSFTDFLQNEPTNKDFTPKFKVLEFWATWCKPCLKAVPHLNSLQRKFRDQNIIFLSVTYQNPEETEKVLEKIRFETVVVSDRTKAVHKKLKVEHNGYMPLPRTVLIDNENRIVWYGSPKELTEEVLRRFIGGKL
ncbi:TlpA family protein disulfide reductase [Sabulibacter ruber]|uniref:TlpA family protein disulfide reductase n=1 Tax=Sabulibacter ruber TaxID=2811901 RepID=UPI001A966B1B|nr:TlpA disulfide reductase family protein [Sabulibacter ruber]